MYHTAAILKRSLILARETNPFSPVPSDLSMEMATKSFPSALYTFLCLLPEGLDDQTSEKLTLNEKVTPKYPRKGECYQLPKT